MVWGSGLDAQNAPLNKVVWFHNSQVDVGSLVRAHEKAVAILPSMGLWEITSDQEVQEALYYQADRYWETLKEVKMCHWNRTVTKRISPNDAFYGNQPYLGHIGLETVWNYQKNGVNKQGDTLVIAYIDDGADTSHPDLTGNLFINRQEIPWNGVDDDANGYIDDIKDGIRGSNRPLCSVQFRYLTAMVPMWPG
jgi:hypothetical protein